MGLSGSQGLDNVRSCRVYQELILSEMECLRTTLDQVNQLI